MELDPYDAHSRAPLLGRAHYASRRYADAVEAYRRNPSPRDNHHADMAACYAQTAMEAEAREEAEAVLRLEPEYSIADYVDSLAYKNPADRAHHADGLRKAGLPE